MRPSRDQYFLRMAELASSRSTCITRKVGCILVDYKNTVLSTGYNGVARGVKHCTKDTCPRIDNESGKSLHLCLASHAEMNALIFCPDTDKIEKAYITISPCLTCTVMLLNTSCKEIIFEKEYSNNEIAKTIWDAAGRIWTQSNPNV